MLGKLTFYESGDRPDIPTERARILPALRQHLQSSGCDISVTPALGGTLGICFDARIAGEKRFVKTHLPGRDAYASLARESDILERLYGKEVVLGRFDVALADGTHRLCLLMPALAPQPAPIEPAYAAAMARECSERLADWRPDNLPTFEHYLAAADRALKTLSHKGLLDEASAAETGGLVALLAEHLPTLPLTLCHGDFGPKNIMLQGTTPRIIDWEDAFDGIAGYDYLYWLTFMENRTFLQTAPFGRSGLSPEIERAILALVVLLKSYLAVCSGAYVMHTVSAHARIAEVLELR